MASNIFIIAIISTILIFGLMYIIGTSDYGNANLIPSSFIRNESINFAANNTDYPVSNPYISGINYIYNDSQGNCTYDSSLYSFNSTHVKIIANDTSGVCPNMTTGVHYLYYHNTDMNVNDTYANIKDNVWKGMDILPYVIFALAVAALISIVIGLRR